MIDRGADVMYAERFGVSDAAKERKRQGRSATSSTPPAQYPGTVLASALWHMEPTIERALKAVSEGRFEAADYGQYSYMQHGGASLADGRQARAGRRGRGSSRRRRRRSRTGCSAVNVNDAEPKSSRCLRADRGRRRSSCACRGVTKRFGALVANDGIDLDLQRGEILALLGENGAGKTTLMNILFGHYVADEGTIAVAGARRRACSRCRRARPSAALDGRHRHGAPALRAGREPDGARERRARDRAAARRRG